MSNKNTVKLSELNPGDEVVCDGGFTCINEGTVLIINANEDGALFVLCDDGKHFLDGQIDFDDGDTLVGITRRQLVG